MTLACAAGGYGSNATTLSVTHPDYMAFSSDGGRAESLGLSPSEYRSDIALTPR
jgi:hypothetical protein